MLAEAASNIDRHGSVLHVLETTIIGWIKQIKVNINQESVLHTNKVLRDHAIVFYKVMFVNATRGAFPNIMISIFSLKFEN